jgi:hypothetical protein
MILHRHLVSFVFWFFTLDLSGCYPEKFNLLHWKPKVAGESDPQFFLTAELIVLFVYFCFSRSTDV